MSDQTVTLGDIRFDNSAPFVLLGGVNVLESRDFALSVAEHYVEVCRQLDIPYVFKASYDKANRKIMPPLSALIARVSSQALRTARGRRSI